VLAHGGEGDVVEYEVRMPSAQQAEEIQPAFRSGGAEGGETIVADLRSDAVLGPMPCPCRATIKVRLRDNQGETE
jgi:hypothetical protein